MRRQAQTAGLMSDRERIVRLETQQQQLIESLSNCGQQLEKTTAEVAELNRHFNRWGAFIAGATVTVSALWAGAIGIWQMVKHLVHR